MVAHISFEADPFYVKCIAKTMGATELGIHLPLLPGRIKITEWIEVYGGLEA